MLEKAKQQGFLVVNKSSTEERNAFRQWTFEQNIPLTTIENRRKYSKVIFDLIFLENRLSDEELEEAYQLISERMRIRWRDCSFGRNALYIDYVPIEIAEDFAGEVNELLLEFINTSLI